MKSTNKKRSALVLGLVPALLVASLAFSSASASAAACTVNILCSGGGAGAKLRDDFVEPPEHGGYGADVLAVNTKSSWRWTLVHEGTAVEENTNPTGYWTFGIKIHRNPATESCKAEHAAATGWVTFNNNSNDNPSAIDTSISPGGAGAWPLSIRSAGCATNPGKVTIENLHLYFPSLAFTMVGTLTGVYAQPESSTCPGGGIKVNKAQSEIAAGAGLTVELDNGAGAPLYICFVASNNVLYPKTAPVWGTPEGSIWKD